MVDIYILRIDVVVVLIEVKYEEIFKVFKELGYLRIFVYEENIDYIIGVMNYKDFFMVLIEGFDIKEIIKDVLFIFKIKKVKDLLLEF